MKERIVIVFIAVALGLFVTTIGFLLYQQTKLVPNIKTPLKGNISEDIKTQPENESKEYLTIDTPKNESISERRTIIISGKTNPYNILIASTNQEDVVATPSQNGSFSISIVIDSGANKIVTRAISPNGEEKVDTRVVTYSQEEF